MNGTLDLHLELEHELADWMQREAALVFTAGYLANLATIATLCGPEDVIVTDAKNHASIEDGAQLSGRAGRARPPQRPGPARGQAGSPRAGRPRRARRLGLRVLHGGRPRRPARLLAISRAAGARTLVDEAHSLGLFGPDGGGLSVGLDPGADLVMGTFSKSLASCGGVIAGDADVIEHLRIHARPFVFTA